MEYLLVYFLKSNYLIVMLFLPFPALSLGKFPLPAGRQRVKEKADANLEAINFGSLPKLLIFPIMQVPVPVVIFQTTENNYVSWKCFLNVENTQKSACCILKPIFSSIKSVKTLARHESALLNIFLNHEQSDGAKWAAFQHMLKEEGFFPVTFCWWICTWIFCRS